MAAIVAWTRNQFLSIASVTSGKLTCLRERYVHFVVEYPFGVIVVLTAVSLLVSLVSLWVHRDAFSFDPRTGFETRGTTLSNQRLAVENVLKVMASSEDLLKRRAKRKVDGIVNLGLSDDLTEYSYESVNSSTNANIAAPSFQQISSPCKQYFALGTYIPLTSIQYLSKIVLQISSFDDLFTLETMRSICKVDAIVEEAIQGVGLHVNDVKKLPFSFNLPYYSFCDHLEKPLNSCDLLTSEGVRRLGSFISECKSDSPRKICSVPTARHLLNFIVEKDITKASHSSSVFITVILPVGMASNGAQSLPLFETLLRKFRSAYNGERVKLVGASFNMKETFFQRFVVSDIKFGVVAVLLVVLTLLLYSNCIFFTISISLGLLLSVGVAFCVYVVFLRISFFPFLNLLAMVLVVAVGADDAFLFLHHFRKTKSEMAAAITLLTNSRNIDFESDLFENLEKCRQRVRECLNDVMAHAAIAMFVTSATTAVAFYANLISHILVLRCFGIYAGTTMVINYVMVITFLPATLAAFETHSKKISRVLSRPSAVVAFFSGVRSLTSRLVDAFCAKLVPWVVDSVRYVLTPVLLALFAASIYAIVRNPGIRLPQRNSMQLLRSDHPFEWFDENAEDLFDFSIDIPPKMNLVAIWGIKPTTTASMVIPQKIGDLRLDDAFLYSLLDNTDNFYLLLQELRNFSKPEDHSGLWIENFSKWTKSVACGDCCLNSQHNVSKDRRSLLKDCFIAFGKLQPFATFNEYTLSTVDGPIFDKNQSLLGYFLVVSSRFRLSTVYHEMKPFFENLGSVRAIVEQSSVKEFRKPLLLTSRDYTSLYDLLDEILNGTGLSVLASLLVSLAVVILTTFDVALSAFAILSIAVIVCVTLAVVLLLGWTVNVVEATITVLTIGISFDYTLHFAVAFKLLGLANFREVTMSVGVPVILAALSSFLAGLALIDAHTQAFFEIGAFLMIMTSFSLLIAFFGFPSFIYSFLTWRGPRTATF